MKRRRFIVAVSAASASLAGCIGSNMPKDAIVRLVQKSPPEDLAVVAYEDLAQAEQRIVRTAIEEDLYHACPELPKAIRSLAERLENPENAYLEHQGTSYGMWIRIEDTVRAGTASPPENTPSCGII